MTIGTTAELQHMPLILTRPTNVHRRAIEIK